jgi:MFS family permease
MTVVGFAMMVEMAARNTALQMMVPDHLRGRIMSLYSMMFLGVVPFGALLAGALAAGIGAPATIALGGAVCVVVSLFFGLRLPYLRAAAQELVAAQQAAPPSPPDQAIPARG